MPDEHEPTEEDEPDRCVEWGRPIDDAGRQKLGRDGELVPYCARCAEEESARSLTWQKKVLFVASVVRPGGCRGLHGECESEAARAQYKPRLQRQPADVLRLPDPMLSRAGPLPDGAGWTYALEWDGFRAIVSTEEGLRVRSRCGWNMSAALPELRTLPEGVMLDGELVAWRKGKPYCPGIGRPSDRTTQAAPEPQ